MIPTMTRSEIRKNAQGEYTPAAQAFHKEFVASFQELQKKYIKELSPDGMELLAIRAVYEETVWRNVGV